LIFFSVCWEVEVSDNTVFMWESHSPIYGVLTSVEYLGLCSVVLKKGKDRMNSL